MAECVGCGYCCIKTPCAASKRLYPSATKCPQLEWKEDRYVCGLMEISGPLGEQYRKELYAGEGCCCSLNSWRQDVKQRCVDLDRTNFNPLPELMQMFIVCAAQEFMSGDVIALLLNRFKLKLERKGYEEAEIDNIIKACMYTFKQNRSGFMTEFMG